MFGLFVIEAGKEPVAVLNAEGKPVVFDTGKEAANAASWCAAGNYWGNGYQQVKCQPRRLASDAWKARELGRFADGTYVALPWADLPKLTVTADHYAHVSTVDGAKIAYTQDAAKGAGDIQTRVKPGKYLQQFYGDVFDAPTIAKMAAEFSLQYGESLTVQFADTAEEIERVYINGPHSCMAYDASHFASPVHPCTIYAAGDLAVAYIVRNEEITARALCWPEKKIYGRVYGDEVRLEDLLQDAGFSQGELDGARMTRIPARNGFVCPYIDDSKQASDNGTHLILGGRGVCGGNQNGLSGPEIICEDCRDGVDEDYARYDDDGNCYCEDCYNYRFSYCDKTDEYVPSDEIREVQVPSRRGGTVTQYWGEYARNQYASECEATGNYFHLDLIVTLADGTTWSQGHFEDNGFVCEGDGECYSLEDAVTLHDGTMWSKDYFSDNGVTVDGEHYAKGDEPQTEEDDSDSEEVMAVIEKPYRASPTVHCPAQLEMPLAFSTLRIVQVDDMFRIMRGDEEMGLRWHTLPYAEHEMADIAARIEAEVR